MDLRVACVLIASPAPPAGLFKISLSPSLSRSLSLHIFSRVDRILLGTALGQFILGDSRRNNDVHWWRFRRLLR